MIDFHTHILPGVDDGSDGVEQSVEMLEKMLEQGIHTIVATPHFDLRQENIESFLKRRAESCEKLKDKIPPEIQMVLGAEVLYCGIPLHRTKDVDLLCIGDTRYILIETLTTEWDDTFKEDMELLISKHGIIPILAHVERYSAGRRTHKILRGLHKKGAVLQMNTELFLHEKTFKKALRFFRKEDIQLIASDCHDLEYREPNLGKAMAFLEEKAGKSPAEEIRFNGYALLATKR